MPKIVYKVFILLAAVLHEVLASSLLDQLNFYASNNYYVTNKFQAPFSLENIMTPSLDMAVESCQQSFQLQRWNCPTADFFLRRTSRPYLLDREDAYVTAITTAAILYTITKNCSSGVVAGCGCADNAVTNQCSDNPSEASRVYHEHLSSTYADDFNRAIRKHNHQSVIELLNQSLLKKCSCSSMVPNGCIAETCFNVLKPFPEIAQDIFDMYQEALQLKNNGINSQIIWENIPLDVIVYSKDSPNYCEPDAIPLWNGMRGRQCTHASGKHLTHEERKSCRNLCRACGFRVRHKNVVVEKRCNCKLTWNYQLQCDSCVTMERQYYCY